MSIFNEEKQLNIFEDFRGIKREKPGSSANTVSNTNWVISEGDGESWSDNIGFKSKKWMLRKRVSQLIKKCKWNPLKFFKEVKVAMHELNPARVGYPDDVDRLIEKAYASHQTALAEHLQSEKERMTMELAMISNDIVLFLTENDLIAFSKNAPRELKLDWVKNFSRVMPNDIYKELNRIEQTSIFDNYVILHYDPKDNGSKLTAKEIEHKKDPILFGVMKCSRRLYFIGDWIDEYCDLTLEEVITVIDKDMGEMTLNEETIMDMDPTTTVEGENL